MKIKINDNSKHGMNLLFPTGLVLNRCSVLILTVKLKKYGIKLSRRQAIAILKELHNYKRNHPEWKLVEVESANGESVQITL